MWLPKLVLCAFTARILAWECGVTPEWEKQFQDETKEARRLQTGTAQPRLTTTEGLRIVPYYMDMSVLPATVTTRIKDVLMPSVLKWFNNVLKVNRISTNLKLAQTTCGSKVTVPTEHQTTGVPDADLIIYVFASTDTAGSWVARAGACAFDGGSSRGSPIAGTFEFNSQYYNADTEVDIEVAVCRHEITHVLAFSDGLYSRYRKSDGTLYASTKLTATVRESSVTELTTPTVLAKAKVAFGCATLEGLELENGGGSGTASSHWEKRLMFNDYMTGSTMRDAIFSDITLALFEDSGWYSVDYTYSDQISFGKNKGCTFFTTKCVVSGVAQFSEFCAAVNTKMCASSNTKKAYCNYSATVTSTIPTANQYFSTATMGGTDTLADFCPYVQGYSNGDCTGRSKTTTLQSTYFGEKVCSTCKCFVGTHLESGYSPVDVIHTGCHDVTCTGGVATVMIGTTAVTCPAAGGRISTINGYTGYIDCPPYAEICGVGVCPNGCFGYGKCVSGACVCNDGYSGDDCSIVCDGTCKTCTGTATNQCASCYANAALSSGSCLCNNGFSLSATTKRCETSTYTCHATCLSCSGALVTQCTSCVSNATKSSTGTCPCNDGFTRSTDNVQCVACFAACATCSGTANTNCLTCKANAALPSGQSSGTCTCNTGFYMKTDSTCGACHVSCKTCSADTATSCTACKPTTATVTGGACVCADGTYLSADGSQCLPCDSTCRTCVNSGASNCKTCLNLGVLTPTGGPGTCGCASGFFYSVPAGCQACHFSCKTCSGTASTQCTTCQSGTPSSTGECPCGGSNFMTTAGVCTPCSQNCLTCIDTATKCTSCDTAVATLGTNTCDCKDGAFKNLSTNRCTPCHATCLTCSSDTETSCNSCVTNATKASNGVCNCNAGFTRSADLKTCVACHASCATCTGVLGTNCVTCLANATVSNGVCTCSSGFYVKADSSCGACNAQCLSCSGPNANNCLSCKTLSTATVSGGYCVCPGHNYLSVDGASCLACDVSCKTCNAAASNACLTCYNLGVLTPTNGPGTCGCSDGLFYTPPDGCLGCHPTCKQCTGVLANQCTSCNANAKLTSTAPSSCICNDGYLSSSTGSCIRCDPNCLTCSSQPTNCTSCKTAVSTLTGNTCTCLTCTPGTSCTQSSFKSSTNECITCDPSCVTCSAASNAGCLSCAPNAVLSSTPGLCLCASGFFPNTTVKNCAACFATCKECTGSRETDCTVCFTPAIRLSTGACACPDAYFPSTTAASCKACDATCKTCSGSTASQCLSCFAQAQLSGTAPNTCVCISGTVARPTSATCGVLNCDLTCKSCAENGPDMCKSCYTNAVGRSTTFPTACICGTNFYPNPNSANCAACDASCQTCSGPTAFSCLSCPTSKVLIDNMYCGDACPTGQPSSTGACLSTSSSAIFRLKLDRVAATLNDTISEAKIQPGNSLNVDSNDPVAYYQQGWLFDGSDDYILLPPTNAETTRNVVLGSTHSMEFWVRPTAITSTGCLATKYKALGQTLTLLRFCVSDTSQLLLEFSAVSLADSTIRVTKTLIGGKVATGREWTSVGYQLVLKSRSATVATLLINQKSVATETYTGLLFRDIIGNVDSVKFVLGVSSLASSPPSNAYKGSIAEVTMYNGEMVISTGSCGCSTCTTGGVCLNQCFASEYFTTAGCASCMTSCTAGCLRGTDCRTNTDPLCSTFTSFIGCTGCSELAELTSTGCQCTVNAQFQATRGTCSCNDGYQKSSNKCVQCLVYFDTTMVTAYFDSNFLQIIIEFKKPVVTRAVSSCAQLFLPDTLAKLGAAPICTWALTGQSVTVFLGTNSTITNEKLGLNYVNLYSTVGTCSFTAVPLEPIAVYKFPLPEITANLVVPQSFSVTCSTSDSIEFLASDTIGGKGRDVTFTWSISSDPLISSLSQYQNYKSTSPILTIAKGLLNTSVLTVKLTARNYWGKENTVTKTVAVTAGAAVTVEVDGGDSIVAQASVRTVIKANPRAICSKASSLTYKWTFTESVPALKDVSFPFLASPSPPNAITIPPNTLKPGYIYSFSVKADDGKNTGGAFFKVTVPKSPLIAELDRTDADISTESTLQISGERSRDPDNLEGVLLYAWSCLEGTNPCTDKSGTAVLVGETKSTLSIPASKLKENSTWNVTLTVSKDNRVASRSVKLNIKSKIAADFTQAKTVDRVNAQGNVLLSYRVSTTLKTTFQWTQTFGGGLQLLTPLTYAYLMIAGSSMVSGSIYTFSLTATNANGVSSASCTITANIPPSSGSATVSPSSGVQMATIFTQTSSNWEDSEQDYPLTYQLKYVQRNSLVNVGLATRSNTRLFKAAKGEYQLIAYVFDSLGSVSSVKLPTVVVTKSTRELQSVDVMNAFMEDTVDVDMTYNMVIAYASSYEFSNSTFIGIFSALQSYVSQVVVLDSSHFDSCINCLDALFTQKSQMNSANLQSLLSFMGKVMDRYEPALTDTQNADLTSVLGRYPGTSEDERTQLRTFLAKLVKSSAAVTVPDQTAASFSSDSMSSYSRRVSSSTLAGMKYSSGKASITFPSDLQQSLSLSESDVLDVRTDTVVYTNSTSDQVDISLYSSGRFVGYSFEANKEATAVIVKNLTTPVQFTIGVNNYKPNATYECAYKDADGKWSSDGVNLTSLTASSAVCSSSHLSTFQVIEKSIEALPTSPSTPPPTSGSGITNPVSDTCSTNFAPIALVCGVVLFGLILTVFLSATEKAVILGEKIDMRSPQNELPNISTRPYKGLEMVGAEKNLTAVNISTVTEGPMVDSAISSKPSFFRLLCESHCLIGLCVASQDLRKWAKALILTTALTAEMVIVGSCYDKDLAQESHDLAEVWTGYDGVDFVYALIGLAVGMGTSVLLHLLFTLASKFPSLSKLLHGLSAVIAVGLIAASAAGSIYMDLDLCFEAGGRWAINFLVLIAGELVICQTILSAGRATLLKLIS